MIRGSRGANGHAHRRGRALILAATFAVNVVPSAADPPPPIAAETLSARSVFPDLIDMKLKLKTHQGGTMVINVDDPSRTVVVRYTVQPGARFPWHMGRWS
jgi:quercetin dioxygenase-like cupin family protein